MEYEDIDPNMRKSAEAYENYPKEKTWRIQNVEDHAYFLEIQRRMEDRTGKYSDQAAMDFMLELAKQRIEQLIDEENLVQDAAEATRDN
jgi:predicted RNA-binding protein YlxR (DUF448 family)